LLPIQLLLLHLLALCPDKEAIFVFLDDVKIDLVLILKILGLFLQVHR
jgi:hypothetical protein